MLQGRFLPENLKFSKTLSVLFILATLLLSSGAMVSYAVSTNNTTAPPGSVNPTYQGPASKGLSGPIVTHPALAVSSATTAVPSTTGTYPATNPKPNSAGGSSLTAATLNSGCNPSNNIECIKVPPTISCISGADCVYPWASSATSALGLNAVNSGALYGEDVEPPDQGLCAGNGYVIDLLNIGEMRVYSSGLAPVSAPVALDSLMGLTANGWSSGGDVQCIYDYSNGGHWFFTEFVSTNTESSGGTFTGCFAGVLDGCLEGIAVSATSNPMGAYNVYFWNPNWNSSEPGNGYLLNDYVKTATTTDAFLLFYDEYNLNPSTVPSCPAFGCFGFNGAQEIAINKVALELGYPISSPFFNVAIENMGLLPIPEPAPNNTCGQTAVEAPGGSCWYQVIPAMSPDPTQFDNSHGGTGFMVASLDFYGYGDNRIAMFYWTGLSSLNSYNPHVHFGGQTLSTPTSYRDEGGSTCFPTSLLSFCGLGVQKTGIIPLSVTNLGGAGGTPVGGGEVGGIATNGDGATQATFADNQVSFAVSTLIDQSCRGTSPVGTNSLSCTPGTHIGASWWSVSVTSFNSGHGFTLASSGYVTTASADMEFPSVATSDGGVSLLSFTISGVNYFPSSAYGVLTSRGLTGSNYYISSLGKAPADGFSEYPGGGYRPRWGDYGAAIYVPSTPGSAIGNIYFASEMIQYPNCSPSHFSVDPTCGGTRDPFANWGSSINYLPVT
jgi:hypothetical protein